MSSKQPYEWCGRKGAMKLRMQSGDMMMRRLCAKHALKRMLPARLTDIPGWEKYLEVFVEFTLGDQKI